jgi:putative dehydrogenase
MCQGGIQRVAVVGLGSMGHGMAMSLQRASQVKGYDPDGGAARRFAEAGGSVAVSAAEAARDADVLVLAVVNAAQTEAVLFGTAQEPGAVATMRAEGVVISSATMAPEDARRIAARCREAGPEYLDAPMSGGATRAATGELTILASGSANAFSRAETALAAMAKTVHRLGDDPGTGSAFKIVNQLLAGVHIAAACEAIAFAKRLDLDLGKVFEVITGSAGNSWMFEDRVPHILAGDYRPASAVDIFTKDLGIVADIGRATNFPTPLAASAMQLFLMTAAAGMGREDDASVARLYARIADLDLPGMSQDSTIPGQPG